MSINDETRWLHSLLSGERRGPGAALLRGLLGAAQVPYAALMRLRNACYDRGWLRTCRVEPAVISVGNITAGGTGKTPMVRWLAQRLAERGMRPAVLMRGYRRGSARISDEQEMLSAWLSGGTAPIIVHAQADRVAGANNLLLRDPAIDVIVLDDGFQHRRLARDFDLVLIDATNPFGYGYVHPRGLLREPLAGLRRADAFVLTRSDGVGSAECARIEGILRGLNSIAPTYRCAHRWTGFRAGEDPAASPPRPLEDLRGRRVFVFAGIAQPAEIPRRLAELGARCVGGRWFFDHHTYTAAQLDELEAQAGAVGAEVLLTTEKDWAKIAALGWRPRGLAIRRIEMQLSFDPAAEAGLLSLIAARLESSRLRRGG
jgi:tetraacyldisaccharide 4'-kinase